MQKPVRICLVSDSHRYRNELLRATKNAQASGAVLHAGDETSDASWLSERIQSPIFAVSGNWDVVSELYPYERVIPDFGPRILLVHGHKLRVKDGLGTLLQRARQVDAAIVVYGHTHAAAATVEDGIVFVNPGSLSAPRGRRERTYAVLEIASNDVERVWSVHVSHFTTLGRRIAELSRSVDISMK